MYLLNKKLIYEGFFFTIKNTKGTLVIVLKNVKDCLFLCLICKDGLFEPVVFVFCDGFELQLLCVNRKCESVNQIKNFSVKRYY